MSNFVQISNTKLEEVKSKLDALPAQISTFDTHESKTSAQHLSELKNASVRDINNTGGIGDGSSSHTSVALGYDRSGGQGRALLVDGSGRLSVDINSGVPTKTDGSTGHSTPTGIGLIGFDSGTANAVHCDSQGVLKVQNVATVNVAPANSLNARHASQTQSLGVALEARTTKTDESSVTPLVCDSDGHLQVDIVSGGGGGSSTYTLEQQSASTGSLQIIGDGAGNQYIDTNGGSKFVVVVQTGDGSGGPVVSVEWCHDTTFSVNQVIVCNGFASGLALSSSVPLSGTVRADSSTLTTQAVLFYDTIPARYARVTVLQSSGSSITYTAKTTLSP